MSVHLNFGFNHLHARGRFEGMDSPPSQQMKALANAQGTICEAFTACLSRIWNAFVRAIRSCLNCFGLFSKDNLSQPPRISRDHNDPSDREFRLTHDESQIQARLARQMQRGMQQMQQESVKPFQYHHAPVNWGETHEGRIGGYQVGVSHAQGRRPTMEDEHLATSFTLTIGGRQYPIQLFGVFDGHGGRDAARYVKDNLKNKLEQALLEFNPQGLSDAGIWRALKMTTARLNGDFKRNCGAVAQNQGTTVTIAMILNQKLWTANVGDARVVLDNRGQPIQMTEDAKPSDPRYRRGIEKRGGVVQAVFGVPRVNGILAVARAVGDHHLNGAVSARPKITAKPLSEIQPHSHLILCCDGVYDVSQTQNVVTTAHSNRNLSAGALARDITYSAYQSGSTDNLTSMVVKIS